MHTQSIEQRLPFKISVCGRSEIPDFKESGITHLLSIDSPGSPSSTPEWFHGVHRYLAFADVESQKMAFAFGLTPPQQLDVEEILDFGKECFEASRAEPVHLVIHCLAGVSRSPASAYAIMCLMLGPGCEKEVFEYLINIRPCAHPNRLIVRYADMLLNRKGAMISPLSHGS